jgi:putative ABC transport system permease protein
MTRSEREDRLREELELHVELATEANIKRGMPPAEARRAALIALGATEHFKEEARDQFRSPLFAAFAQDARYAWRTARRTPMLTGIAIVTLAAAFALATSAFTAVNGVLLRALPYPAPDRLTLIWGTERGKADRDPVSFTNAMDWRRATKSLESLAMFSCTPRPILAARGEPARASMMEVSSDFFRVLEARPLLGRLFDSTDFIGAHASTVVLTYPLWRDRFGSSPSAINSRVLVDGAPVTVIGVLSADYSPVPSSLACRPELYRPLESRYDDAQRSWSFLKVIARLGPGASLAQAQAELDVTNSRLAEAYPATNLGHGAAIVSLREFLTRPLRPTLLVVQVGALLVLLIACANVASLLLARATVRRREFAIRAALGGSRGRIARQIATECLLLGAAAGALGTLLTFGASGLLTRFGGDALPDPRGLAVDWRVIAFAVVLSLVATSTFGLTVIATARGDGSALLSSLRDGGRGGTASRSRLRRMVVTAQLALAMVVLVCAGLLARSYRRLREVHPGFDPNGVLTARVSLPEALYPRGQRQIAFFQQVIERLTHERSVVAVGAVSILPESPNFDHTNAKVVGREYTPGDEPAPDVYRVTPGYFDALRIPVRNGRVFTATDDDRHPLVAVINETMARMLFPGETAVGRRIWTGAGNAERTIVGVVGDVYQYGLDSARTMQLYVPHADNSGGDLTLVVRSASGAALLSPLVRAAARAADPGVPVDDVMTMDQVLAASAGRRRLLAGLSLVFALGAIGLAAIGLYGVIAYSVAQRTQEIGVRIALGATARAVVRQVISDAFKLVAAGLVTGLLAAIFLARLMAPLVFGVSVSDAVTFVGAPMALFAVALVAAVVPAARAGRVSPLTALRNE